MDVPSGFEQRQAEADAKAGVEAQYPAPAMRRLRVYAFDPQASLDLDTAVVNDAVISLPWETPWEEPLTAGPRNEYLEVIDYDPTNGLFYAPVDLSDPLLLAQDGLPPSEAQPQFHQQMVFAVAMKTIRLFERALGRSVMWAMEPRETEAQRKERADLDLPHPRDKYVKRLRIYPHALREANAYYSPEKTALLFGYFRKGEGEEAYDKDSGWVFTCLSQDIIAHETAHAILHGMERRSIEASNPDSRAFHEAFADIVALFQHFAMTDVVAHQIAHTRGSLRALSLLTGLAQQFGHATGRGGALRSALDTIGREAKAMDAAPDAGVRRETISRTTKPHDRGGFLVAAVFDAFVTIYERRTEDLMRLATGSSRPDGRELSPDLVRRLAAEATKAADHLLRMCVRGLDYLPPTGIRFGEYLRAVVTADADLVPDDPLRYRVALAEAFSKRGIFAPGCLSMSPPALYWEPLDFTEFESLGPAAVNAAFERLLPNIRSTVNYERVQEEMHLTGARRLNLREESFRVIRENQIAVHRWLKDLMSGLSGDGPEAMAQRRDWERMLGVKLDGSLRSISRNRKGEPAVEVHSARIARRAGPDGQELRQLIVQITQRRRAYADDKTQDAADDGSLERTDPERWNDNPFWFRGGCTIHVDLRDGRVRRVMRTRIDNDARLEKERAFRTGPEGRLGVTEREPFAILHRS
ncbi:hypothetical protein [Sphingosinicella terrae]|uniref:hypothetical protein n=1 Tax=Sphingosinicella terrae TaxID=2172047 RepID=UPI000E0DBAED|nr:hypothetical protein [Sphingosinicella terrae]